MNVMFDETDQENMPRVLADLHVSQCNGPKDLFAMHNVHVKCFKIDSGACGNLIPLSSYLDLFPNSSVSDLQSTIDHRVQLVAYNKNLMSWPENQGILFFIYFSNISNELDIFHGCTS